MTTNSREFRIENGLVRIVQDDITSFNQGDNAGAIVLPCFFRWGEKDRMDVHTVIWRAICDKLEELGVEERMFSDEVIFRGRQPYAVEPMSAHFYRECDLPDVDVFILAACLGGKSPYEKAQLVTANVLTKASENNVSSIAFPPYMTGYTGGPLDSVIPGMTNAFTDHLKTGDQPKDISLYIHISNHCRDRGGDKEDRISTKYSTVCKIVEDVISGCYKPPHLPTFRELLEQRRASSL